MFRKAVSDDCKRIYELICDLENIQFPYERFFSIFQNQLQNDHYYCLVYEYENNVIAFLNLRVEEQLHHSDYVSEIMEFVVDSAFRKHGIGKSMFIHACQIAKDLNCCQIEVACNQLRKDTHSFYLREGMHNYHYKFSKSLTDGAINENRIGR